MTELVRTVKHVKDFGEVLTPSWLISKMLADCGDLSSDPNARTLEPSCGTGNFLVEVAKLRLKPVDGVDNAETAVRVMAKIYGVEIQKDNMWTCRKRLLKLAVEFAGESVKEALKAVIQLNVVQGDALRWTTPEGGVLVAPDWEFDAGGMVTRTDYDYKALLGDSGDSMFGLVPIKTYEKTHYTKLTL